MKIEVEYVIGFLVFICKILGNNCPEKTELVFFSPYLLMQAWQIIHIVRKTATM